MKHVILDSDIVRGAWVGNIQDQISRKLAS
jgi:hypothetical protein